ncbi:MAG: MerR family transcriptional regulator [Gemmatimonadetes bacterium]|nr:MerR family transcriptional regulator [Gemmatimonadota bacterium]
MNVTLAVDGRVLERARKAAAAMGKSLNQAIREYLETLAGTSSPEEDIAEVKRLSGRSKGRRRGWRFDRDALHERS